jgi:hypothetical protein
MAARRASMYLWMAAIVWLAGCGDDAASEANVGGDVTAADAAAVDAAPDASTAVAPGPAPDDPGTATPDEGLGDFGGADSGAPDLGPADPEHCLLAVGATLLEPSDPSKSAMQVEPVQTGGDFNDNFVIANVGRTPCNISAITLDSPSGAFSFPFASQVATPTSLAFRQLRLINIGHAPTAARADTATLTVVSDDGLNPTQTMTIHGRGY